MNPKEEEYCLVVAFSVGAGLLGCLFIRNTAREILESRRRTRAAVS